MAVINTTSIKNPSHLSNVNFIVFVRMLSFVTVIDCIDCIHFLSSCILSVHVCLQLRVLLTDI